MKIENHPVTLAIAPLKADAVRDAEKNARQYIEEVNAKLAAHDYDFNAAYPEPDFYARDYRYQKFIKTEARSLVKPMGRVSYMRNAPLIVIMCAEGIERYVQNEIKSAEASFEAFAFKLAHKIGECQSASLDVEGTWGYSVLRVIKSTGVERWQTRRISNRSKLGKWFNQFPTRKLK